MHEFLQLVVGGLLNGGLYGAFSLCFCLVHRISRVLNFALGDFAMVGALGVSLMVEQHHLAMVWAVLVVVVAVAAIAYGFHRLVLESALAHRTDFVTIFLLTFALSMVVEGGGIRLFGPDVHSVPAWIPGSVTGDRVVASWEGLLLLGTAVVAAVALGMWLRSSLYGRAMTACGDNDVGARVVGINVRKFQRRTFVAAGIGACMFGVIYAPISSFTYQSGFQLGLTGLLAATLAGLNSPLRGFAMGIGVGIGEQLISGYVSTSFADVILYGILALLLIWRPQVVPAS